MSRPYRAARRRVGRPRLGTSRRCRQTFELLEKRLLLADDFFLVPGVVGEAVDLEFRWTSRDAAFNNELGVFVVQDEQGSVDGIAPGESPYAQTALGSAASDVVFASGQGAGAERELTYSGGDRLAFYLVQNNTTDTLLAQNPQNDSAQRPIGFFSVDTANPDGFDHVRSQQGAGGVWDFLWEDVTGGGDRDFNDVVFTVSVVEAPPPEPPIGPPVGRAGPVVADGLDDVHLGEPGCGVQQRVGPVCGR
jgi:hypothetical protein